MIILLLAFPVISILLVVFGGRYAKWLAFGSSVIELFISHIIYHQFQFGAATQFLFDQPWIPQLGINFTVGIDGISMLMVLLTTILVPLIILSSFKKEYARPGLFYGLILLMQTALLGVFTALDAFAYYIFWEMALVPIYFIILMWGGENRVKVTYKFFIYTMAGSLLMLIAIIFIFFQTPEHSFSHEAFSHASAGLSPTVQGWLFWAFFIAFAIKMPIFPFHTWQPDTYTQAPPQGTMLLSGIMLKMGTYSLIRWILPIVPQGVMDWGNVALILSIISIVYGSLIAISQKDLKRMFAWSSIAHVGLISAGIFSLTVQGLQGGMIQMLSHGINIVGLFFVAQIIFDRTKTSTMSELGGIINKSPVFAGLFLIILLGSVALPLTNGFIGEFLLLSGVYQYNAWMAAVAGLTIILGAVYMLRAYQRSILGEVNGHTEDFAPLQWNETLTLVCIAGMVLFIGIYPQPILDLTGPAIKNIVDTLTNQIHTLR